MTRVEIEHVCPCCGYRGLDEPAYAGMPPPPWTGHLEPPYCVHYGNPSYEVCPSCGFEFGYDDEPGIAPGVSFDEYRRDWIARGSPWFDNKRRPAQWSLADQLRSAGLAAG